MREVAIGVIALGVGLCLLATAVMAPFAILKYLLG